MRRSPSPNNSAGAGILWLTVGPPQISTSEISLKTQSPIESLSSRKPGPVRPTDYTVVLHLSAWQLLSFLHGALVFFHHLEEGKKGGL
ncbi:hypothetical protein MRB53_010309 [Persea americana]|uniref:Uncharacterized protein n=1 Tax=Persea americana TaxID=3435 RepID=A0ACC2LRI2_PERAE|nr:hypothetical protein MRB53_010309 [Persea americana]